MATYKELHQGRRKHLLVTQPIAKALEQSPLYSHDGKPGDAPVIVKFFSPYSGWYWYAIEGERQDDGDWLFYGLVKGLENELGYFVLSELEQATGMKGALPLVERDCHFGKHTLGEFLEQE